MHSSTTDTAFASAHLIAGLIKELHAQGVIDRDAVNRIIDHAAASASDQGHEHARRLIASVMGLHIDALVDA